MPFKYFFNIRRNGSKPVEGIDTVLYSRPSHKIDGRNGSKSVEGIDTNTQFLNPRLIFSRNGRKPVEGIDTTACGVSLTRFTSVEMKVSPKFRKEKKHQIYPGERSPDMLMLDLFWNVSV